MPRYILRKRDKTIDISVFRGLLVQKYGTETSGNYGHEGRPGEVGGSAPGGYSTDKNVPKAIASRVDSAMSVVGGQGLLLKGNSVEFRMGAESQNAGQYSEARTLNDRSSGKTVDLPATVAMSRGISEPEIVHEYGHHFDSVMGGQSKVFWSDTAMTEWTGSTGREDREKFAEMFTVLAFKGSTYKNITIPSVPENQKEAFHSWFDKSVKDFAKGNK